jgi:hypothetical protein
MSEKRYGRLVVLDGTVVGKKVLCKCDCGTIKMFTRSNLGKCTFSCGCLRKEQLSARNTTHGQTRGAGGRSSGFTREYVAWRKMRQRCLDDNCPQYPYYGGRGIKIDSRWNDFHTFLKDVGPRPGPGYSLDRYPDMNGDYTPGNVRWATKKQQANNMRSNKRLTLNGETLTIHEWSERIGIKVATLRVRLSKGWGDEKTLTTPLGPTSGRKQV